MLKMCVIDMCVNSEQTLENHFDCRVEIFWEGNANRCREEMFIIKLVFNPGH